MGKDPGKVSLSVLLQLLVTGRILPIQNSSKQESENTYIEWFLHTLGEARTVASLYVYSDGTSPRARKGG